MTAIPLCCYICPQQPNFSDLSHLLTHVSSKGHLSHHLKAQLRGRGEPDVREKLDTYDQWYECHHIEQLLSQRLSAKASRNGLETERKPSTRSTKTARSLKGRIRRPKSLPQPSAPITTEPAIDPQLSHSQVSPSHAPGTQFRRDVVDTKATQPLVPHMSEFQYWQGQTNLDPHETSYIGIIGNHEQPIAAFEPDNESDSAVNNDYFKAFVRSPTRSAPPESPKLKPSIPTSQQPSSRGLSERSRLPNGHTLFVDEKQRQAQSDLGLIGSPVLKGVKWPGMALFDSACADAQRLRNQKKDGSIIEQMAQNSSVVEQMEHIYWPDGTLKKSRFITGNVESSPSSQASPVLKTPRRARTTKPRTVLANLDTNGPNRPEKGNKRLKTGRLNLNVKNRDKGSKPTSRLAGVTPEAVRPAKRRDIEEQCPPGESPSIRPPRRNVDAVQRSPDPFSQPRYSFESSSQHGVARYRPDSPVLLGSAPSVDWYNRLGSYPKTPVRSETLERAPPEPKSQANDTAPNGSLGRITQRYFSVSGSEEPQFFATMPPQMEFGGMAGPKYRGAMLNPLNPYLRQSRPRPSHM